MKIVNKYFVLSFAFALSLVYGLSASAMTLADASASSTGLMTDNADTFILFFIALATTYLVISASKGMLIMAIKWIKKSVFGGKRR